MYNILHFNIVHFPDTIIAYERDQKGRETNIVKTVAFKIRQNINIIDFLLGSDFEILAMDLDNDVALIGKNLKIDTPFTIPVFKFPQGIAQFFGPLVLSLNKNARG